MGKEKSECTGNSGQSRIEIQPGLSMETYLRLKHSGLAVLKPNIAAKEDDWKLESNTVQEVSRADAGNAATGRLFVGGLAWQTTEDSLGSYFGQFGALLNVVVMEGRGFGFLRYRNPSDASNVLKNTTKHVVDEKSVEYVNAFLQSCYTKHVSPFSFNSRLKREIVQSKIVT